MNCSQYKELYEKFSKPSLPKEIWDTEEYEEWSDHSHECYVCSDWDLEQRIINKGHNLSDYPCVHIAYHVTDTCEVHQDPWECPDIIIVKIDNSYGIPIKDGGTSMVEINYCPWCGQKI